MRAIVFGDTGLIGSAIVRKLKASGWDVSTLPRGFDLRRPGLDVFRGEECDAIFHAADAFAGNAALVASNAWNQLVNNVSMDLNVLNFWRDRNPKAKLIAFLSLWAYPASGTTFHEKYDLESGPMPAQTAHYGAVKRLLVHGLKALETEWGMPSAVLTLPNVYGPGDRSKRIVPTVLWSMLAGKDFTLRGDGSELRDFAHVDDVAAAAFECATSDLTGRLHVGPYKPTSILELVNAARRATGFTGNVRFEGAPAASRCIEPTRRAEWQFRDLESGLVETVADMKAQRAGNRSNEGF